ncbi:MAG TPA: DUF4403 family protein, partial [Longimicrobiales bacterium]|nr:DUF4403 family protein [Longimicrobiales bacterium]
MNWLNGAAAWYRALGPMTRRGIVAILLVVVGMAGSRLLSGRGLLEPAPPALSADAPDPAVVPASVVAAPIRIPLARLTELLEDAVPTEYGDLAQRHELSGRERTEVSFHLERGLFDASVTGDVVTLRAPIHYALRAFYDPPVLPEMSASCGTETDTPSPRLNVAISAPVSVDRDWRLRTDVRVLDIGPATDTPRDRCLITFLDLDITGTVVDAARGFLEDHVDHLDSLAASVDVRSSMEEWWRVLDTPIHLSDSLWLTMGPEALQRGDVTGHGDSLDVALALRARPSLRYGPRPSPVSAPLPPLEEGDVPSALDLRVEARIDYAAASDL